METSVLLMAEVELQLMLMDLDLVLEEMHILMRLNSGLKTTEVGKQINSQTKTQPPPQQILNCIILLNHFERLPSEKEL